MTLRKGLPAKLAATDANDTRYDFNNLVVCNADGSPRGGVTAPLTALVSATATMNVSVAAFSAVAVRDGGTVLLANDGPVNVLLSAAPASNSRIDVIYAKQNDASSTVTTPDGNNTPVIDKVTGTAAASPTKPSIPAGAVELATVQVPSTATATNSGGVVINQTAQFTAAPGGSVPFPTVALMNAWTTPGLGQKARVNSDPTTLINGNYVWSGTAWVADGPRILPPASGKTGTMPAGAIPIIQSSRVAAVTAANGSVPNVLFNTPFPNGVSTIVLTTGSGSASPTVLNGDALNLGGFNAVVGTTAGASVVFYYMAIGW
jgi:hypothetical protein